MSLIDTGESLEEIPFPSGVFLIGKGKEVKYERLGDGKYRVSSGLVTHFLYSGV